MRYAILASGGGTTAEAILRSTQEHDGVLKKAGVGVPCLITNRKQAGVIQKFIRQGFDPDNIYTLPLSDFDSPEERGKKIIEICQRHGVDAIGQHGWMVRTTQNVIEAYSDMMINQHPGPAPNFGGEGWYGRRVHCARLLFVRMTKRNFWTEVVAQRVSPDYDRGTVIKKERIDILPGDTVDLLQERSLPKEHEVQIQAIRDMAIDQVVELPVNSDLVRGLERVTLKNVFQAACLLYPRG